MLLISESLQEDHLVLPISVLLGDLGVEVAAFERSDAVAPLFWDISDLYSDNPAFQNLDSEEKKRFLILIEQEIRNAMMIAGFIVIEEYIQKYIET